MSAPDHEVVVLENLKCYLLICHIYSLSKGTGLSGEWTECDAKLEDLLVLGFGVFLLEGNHRLRLMPTQCLPRDFPLRRYPNASWCAVPSEEGGGLSVSSVSAAANMETQMLSPTKAQQEWAENFELFREKKKKSHLIQIPLKYRFFVFLGL